MTPLSKWRLAEKEEERIKKLLVDRLSRIENDTTMREFLNLILSETELIMISKRMVAVLLIEMGKTDVEIGKLLHLTRSTVSRFRQTYKFGRDKPEVVKVVNELRDNSEMKEFLKRLTDYLLTAPFGRIPKRSIF